MAAPPLREEIGYIADKVKKAEKQIGEHPYDLEAWGILIREAQRMGIEAARKIYERLVTQFPNAGRFWKTYIEHEMKFKHYEQVEKLFQRCLIRVLHIDLWKTYLAYIKETKAAHPSFREKMAQAFDFALDKIGMDLTSYPVWFNYITFLKSINAVGSFAESQKISAIRKVYQRGVVMPMLTIAGLWGEYTSWETGVNSLIAKKMIEDRGRDYMNARRVTKEYEGVIKGLNRNAPSVPPRNAPDEAQQVDLWKKYINWEKSNPLRTEDHALLTKRVMFAYEQCLLCLGHHADIWYEAASFLEYSSKVLIEKGDSTSGKIFADEAAAIYERATSTIMKKNLLINFAYADFEESRMHKEKVHKIFEQLLEQEDIDPTPVYVMYMRFARRAEGIKAARNVFKKAREDNRSGHQVFVAAAKMEYYCSKDKKIGKNILDLGLKRYGDVPEYVGAFIDYMNTINEDNNTRVLFEKVLTSGKLGENASLEVWSQFIEFEINVGDLTSVAKVEARRNAVLQKLEQLNGRETALLVDRYKFMDMLPCNLTELRAIGYKESQRVASAGGTGGAMMRQVSRAKLGDDDTAPQYPRPDTHQMIPFKPKALVPYGAHAVSGGVFPPPPAAAHLMTVLPPPHSFDGPFVKMEQFIEHFMKLKLPDELPSENGGAPSTPEPGTALTLRLMKKQGRKRHGPSEGRAESGDEEGAGPPVNDLYRARQHKKAR